jgi:hypothetical protein
MYRHYLSNLSVSMPVSTAWSLPSLAGPARNLFPGVIILENGDHVNSIEVSQWYQFYDSWFPRFLVNGPHLFQPWANP